MKRRRFLANTTGATSALSALAVPTLLPGCALAAPTTTAAAATPAMLGEPAPFDLAWLKQQARALSQSAWQSPAGSLPPAVSALDFDAYQQIQFKGEQALWAADGLRFQVRLFHPGLYFKRRVRIHEVRDGRAQEIAYSPALFDYGRSGLDAAKLPANLGFAGFRISVATAPRNDMVAFLGGSYFRAVGGSRQYGLSARGLAVDPAMGRDEEFPDFTAFWLERPTAQSQSLVVYALLDSPGVTGAFRFAITPGDSTVMEVDSALYPRREIDRIGIAPCTSMYLVGENNRRAASDWRPEIHDSDGLQMRTGAGEWIWRPLNNPNNLRINAYADNNPRGFGLLQRDRNFDHYQDDSANYDRRPSLWVEPRGDWGPGQVQLVEIPTPDETFDNIVCYWNPAQRPQAGQELLLGYRLFWGATPPARSPLARCIASRTGLGGTVGKKRTKFSWRFAVDFAGGNLPLLDSDAVVEAVVTVSRGQVELVSARPQAAIQGWRALFDVVPDDRTDPIALRMYLRVAGQALTETWIYEWAPPTVAARAAML
ncbi:glucan biosynthesis protein [Xylophilus sp. GOD-11R]|uniref:glucan biosynthesis protein n=1 Tax=Xylophilus sp. GOD-11R TaxID=3089814 RepID=UPI00399AAC17